MTNTPDDPTSILNDLGAIWSPDFAAYAAGEIDISQVRSVPCRNVPCRNAPCKCYPCPARGVLSAVCGWTRPPDRPCPACGAK